MLLKEFPNIVVDELPLKPDPRTLYFLSRPMHNVVRYDETNKIHIFTTKEIRKFLRKAVHAIPGQFIRAIDECKVTPDKRAVRVHTIRTGSVGGNVMYMFEYMDEPHSKTLYTGQYAEHGNIFNDKSLNDAIKSHSITNLYIDNTLASAVSQNSAAVAATWIAQIRRQYPEHKIYLFAERLGCENLLYELATVHNLKIYLNQTRRILLSILGNDQQFCADKNHADVFVFEEQPPYKLSTFQSAFKNKNINVRLITAEKEEKPIGVKWINNERKEDFIIENGIVYIPYAPHPSAEMVLIMLNRVQPKKVVKLAENTFHGLCSNILDRVYSEPVIVEDGHIEECAAHTDRPFNFHSLIDEEEEDERSFLSRSSISVSLDLIDDHADETNGKEQVGEPKTNNEPIVDLTEDSTHYEDDQRTNGNGIADDSIVINHDETMHDNNCNAIEVIRTTAKVNGKKATNVSEQKAKTAKRKPLAIDSLESIAKAYRRKGTNRIQYLSSSSSSTSSAIAPTHDKNQNRIDDNASIKTLSIHSSLSSEIDPFHGG